MAYTRQYPNSITPNGSTTRDCLENDDKELKRVLDLLGNVGGLQLSGTKRQCVLYGSTDASGNPNFLTASGLTVSIDGSIVPVILSFANGFSISSGTVDTLAAITSMVSNAWTVPANGTYYLYIDKDMSTGLISYGVTASPDTYSKVAPTSPVLDQCYFNTNEMKMYHYNGSSWEQKYRIFVAVVVSTATTATVYTRSMTSPTDTSVKNELSRGNKYIVGDIAYSNQLPTWARLECVTAGTTAPAEPDLSTYTTAGAYILDGTVKWIIADIRDAAPVGELQLFYSLHPGYVKANGATVLRSDYPRLVAFANDNNLWADTAAGNFPERFGTGDGSTTFTLPNAIDRVMEAGNVVGSYNAGLPNITGDIGVFRDGYTVCDGVFALGGPSNSYTGNNNTSGHCLNVNASRSSPIYGASTTVQPRAIALIPQLRY